MGEQGEHKEATLCCAAGLLRDRGRGERERERERGLSPRTRPRGDPGVDEAVRGAGAATADKATLRPQRSPHRWNRPRGLPRGIMVADEATGGSWSGVRRCGRGRCCSAADDDRGRSQGRAGRGRRRRQGDGTAAEIAASLDVTTQDGHVPTLLHHLLQLFLDLI